MRIWSVHPQLLDRAALVSGWRESLLAQAVLAGRTKGYRSHPQLQRWRESTDPLAAIGTYLHGIADEADARGYRFDRARIERVAAPVRLPLTTGQLDHEWAHLRAKVQARDAAWDERLRTERPRAHPIFDLTDGPRETWEVGPSS